MSKHFIWNSKDEVIALYKAGKTPTEISKFFGCKYSQPVTHLLKKELSISSFRPYQGNIRYFQNIDTHSKAYILGFIAADGALVASTLNKNNYTLTITIKNTDRSLLEFIKSEIGNEHKIQDIIRPSSFDFSKTIHHCRFVLTNQELSKDLISWGIQPRKSLNMENLIPMIPKDFRKAFILGYFDGDGSVSLPINKNWKNNNSEFWNSTRVVIQIRGTNELLQGIYDELQLETSTITQYDSIPQLTIRSRSDVTKFYKCYEGLSFFLKRKHEKFLQRDWLIAS